MFGVIPLFIFVGRHWSLFQFGNDVEEVTEPIEIESQPIHVLRSEENGFGRAYLVRNLLAGPIEVDCRLEIAENVKADPALPRRFELSSLAERGVTVLRNFDLTQPSRASLKCDAIEGDPQAVPDAATKYLLPFYPGTTYVLAHGKNGGFIHHDPESLYAFDLRVPVGTPVLAARDGVVMQVEQSLGDQESDFKRNGKHANFIRVLHADGSMAVYAYLAPHSSTHIPGDHVHAGDLLGKIGNTGYALGSHLHFAVQKNVDMALQSIPFTMAGVDPRPAR
jgi:hypothetical protein